MERNNFFTDFVSTVDQFIKTHSQRELSGFVGCSESSISKMVNSKRQVFVCQSPEGRFYLTEIKVLGHV